MEYELIPKYTKQKSFYRKAIVIQDKDEIKLKSYNTIVAKIIKKDNKTIYKYLGNFSNTTKAHQKEFFKQNGLNDEEIKKLFKEWELEYE